MTTTAQIPLTIIEPEKTSKRWRGLSRALVAYSFLVPWLIGFLGLTLGPTLASLYLSFTNFDLLQDPQVIGLANYQRIFTNDREVLAFDAGDVHVRHPGRAAEAGLRARIGHGAQSRHRRPAPLPRPVLSALAARRERRHRRAVAPALREGRSRQRGARRSSASTGRAGSRTRATRSIRWSCSASGSSARR